MLMKRFCPNCGGEDVELVAGGTIGMYMCRDCGYSGSIFPEKPFMIKGKEMEESMGEDGIILSELKRNKEKSEKLKKSPIKMKGKKKK